MSTSHVNNAELVAALDKLFGKYFKEKVLATEGKDPVDTYYETYLKAVRGEDEARTKDWDGNTGSILTFIGLFAATVAAFVIESYKLLQPDSGVQTVELLSQLITATTNKPVSSVPMDTSSQWLGAPITAVVANTLWFISLIVALACALLATLVQQWSRDYVRDIRHRSTLDESAKMR
ncbi:hypothetical protein PENSPDRAFT_581759, partial [Peniophora sp. CONT]